MQCPQCGESMELFPCPSCGYTKFGECLLSGPSGTMKISVNTMFGRRNLITVLPEEDLRCFCGEQFRLEKSESAGAWVLIALPDTPNVTALNGTPCADGEEFPLEDGDILAVASRRDPSIIRGQITVEILN